MIVENTDHRLMKKLLLISTAVLLAINSFSQTVQVLVIGGGGRGGVSTSGQAYAGGGVELEVIYMMVRER